MQQNSLNANMLYPNYNCTQGANPNAVSINIYSPQAYGNTQNPISQQGNDNFYHLYGPNIQNNMPFYPANYNNMFNPQVPAGYQQNPMQNINGQQPGQYSQYPQNPGQAGQMYDQYPQQQDNPQLQNGLNAVGDNSNINKTNQPQEEAKTDNKEKETKVVTPLTDDYVKSLENYLNDSNPKVRLIGAKELMERFKEDDNRKDNKSLIPLLNKTLRDTSASVRFLALTTLQLGYCVGNDETVQILKEIQANNQDKTGQDQLLATEILLKMVAPQEMEVGA